MSCNETSFLSYVLAMSVAASLAVGCGDDGGSVDIPGLPSGDDVVVALGSNYADSSVLSRVVLPELFVDVAGIDGVASLDPVIRQRGDYLFVVNRFGFDNVTILDASDHSLIGQISTGAGSNPQDVAVTGSRAFVATFGGKGLVAFDVNQLDAGVTEIDLSSLDPDDETPNCIAAEIVDGDVWVACRRADDNDDYLTPRGVGRIAIVDVDSETLTSTVDMQHSSPIGFFARSAERVYLGTVPDFFQPASDGCIERFKTSGSELGDGCLVDNEDLGGYAAHLVWGRDGLRAAVVSGFDADDFGALGKVVAFAGIGSDAVELTALTDESVRALDVAVCPDGRWVAADATRGLRVYERDGTELTEAPIDIGAPVVQGGILCM